VSYDSVRKHSVTLLDICRGKRGRGGEGREKGERGKTFPRFLFFFFARGRFQTWGGKKKGEKGCPFSSVNCRDRISGKEGEVGGLKTRTPT